MSEHDYGVDITERQQAEQAQRRMDELFRALIENALDVITIIDAEGVIRYQSPSVERVLGYEPAELIGVNIVELLHPDDVPKVNVAIKAVAPPNGTPGIAQVVEARLRHKDGSWRLLEGIGKALPGGLSVTGIVFNSRDITERVRAEEALQASYRHQAGILGSMLDAVVVANPDGTIRTLNRAALELLGYAEEEIIGRPVGTIFEEEEEEEEEEFFRGSGLAQLVREGAARDVELTLLTKWGERIPVMLNGSIIREEDGGLMAVVGVARDMRERKRAEEELQRRAARLTSILQLGIELATLQEERLLLDTLVTRTAALADSPTCTVMLIDEATNEAVLAAHTGLRESTPPDLRVPLTLPLLRHALETGEPLILSDIDRHAPEMRTILVRKDINAFFAYPMVREGHPIGFITLSGLTPRTPSAEEITACQLLAERAGAALENARLFQESQRRLERVQALRTIDMAITASFDLRVTLNVILDQATTHLGIDAVAILLLDSSTYTLEYAAWRGFRTAVLQRSHVRLGEGHAGLAALERRLIAIADLRSQIADLAAGQSAIQAERFVAYYAAPLISKGQVKGVLEIFHRAPLYPDQGWLDSVQALAAQAAIAIDNASLFDDLQRSNFELALAYDSTLEGWSKALELRDRETEGHARRVTEMTLRLARAMGMSNSELVHVRRGALLHDIGKMGVPDSILLKPGPLTDEERAIIRRHPVYAYEMLRPIAYLRRALDIPYCHHEKWDGTGYPQGLKGEQIPLPARVFAVADVYDALLSDRPYRAAWPGDAVIAYIREQAGQHFDPQVVEVFLELES